MLPSSGTGAHRVVCVCVCVFVVGEVMGGSSYLYYQAFIFSPPAIPSFYCLFVLN